MQSKATNPRPRFQKWLMVAGGAMIAIAVILVLCVQHFSPLSRRWVVKILSERYQCDVELKSFYASVFPRISVSGGGLVLRYRSTPGRLLLASIKQFSINAGWTGLLRHHKHLRQVELQGLVLNIPPPSHLANQRPNKKRHRLPDFDLGKVIADGTVLNIFSSNPQKPPVVFAISRLRLHSAGIGRAMLFQATLTNPKPVGQIQTAGKFGPWSTDDPSQTPVSGTYSFHDADLSTLRGLEGILSSRGNYGGLLSRIKVQGETDTPNFALSISAHPVHLKTQFNALVDGTSGDTFLQPVNAQLGHSSIVARGAVLRTTGMEGRTIALHVTAAHAALEDLLGLAVKSGAPPLMGGVNIDMGFGLPPGNEDVTRRLKLAGNFSVQSARFTSSEVEEKMTRLSRRGEGRPGQDDGEPVALNMNGHFVLSNGVMAFSRLAFDIPGTSVTLNGTYGLLSEDLNFRGTVRLQAELSQTTTGVRSYLLRVVNPLFKGKGAGTVVPVKITGKRQHPSFRVEIGKILKRIR